MVAAAPSPLGTGANGVAPFPPASGSSPPPRLFCRAFRRSSHASYAGVPGAGLRRIT